MAKLFKWLLAGVLIIMLTLIVAAYIATRAIDTDTIRPILEEQTKANTGLDLRLNGELSWSFFPRIKAGVSDIELHTAKSYAGDTLFARIGSAGTSLTLSKLLRGVLAVDKLALADIELRLITDQRGHSNWKDIEPQSSDASTSSDAEATQAQTKSQESSSLELVFDNVDLKNINVELLDQTIGSEQALLLKQMQGRDINFSGKPFSLRSTLEILADGQTEPYVLTFASPFRFDASRQLFAIEAMQGSFDAINFSGQGSVSMGKDTEFNASLALDTIDLNRYIDFSEAAAEGNTENSNADSSSADEELPLDILHTLNTELELSIEKLIYDKTTLSNIRMAMAIDDGVLNVSQLDAEVYNGRISQSIQLDARQSPARLQATQSLQNIDMAAMLTSNDVAVGLSGLASLQTTATARGSSSAAMLKTLDGSTSVKLAKLFLADENLEQRICQSIALVRQTPLTQQWSTGTELNDVDVQIGWNRGVGNIESLTAGLANAGISGDGKIDLVAASYDLRLLANISGQLASAQSGTQAQADSAEPSENGCQINERYRDIQWPLRCRGDAETTSCGVDNSRLDKILAKLAKDKAKAAVDRELDKQTEKLQEKLGKELGEGIGDALRGLFR